MGHIHICGEGDTSHNQHIQAHRHTNSIPDQQHHPKSTHTEKPEPRQVLIMRRLQTHMP
jgi:hypothetical protein